jgi:hypothetical protein
VAVGNTDPPDHPHYAVAPLITTCTNNTPSTFSLETAMKSKLLAAALLGTALLSGVAYAQTAEMGRPTRSHFLDIDRAGGQAEQYHRPSQPRQPAGARSEREVVSGPRGLQRHKGPAEGDAAVQVRLTGSR